MYKGDDWEAAAYDDLTIAEFAFGYINIFKASDISTSTRMTMIDHLQELVHWSKRNQKDCGKIPVKTTSVR